MRRALGCEPQCILCQANKANEHMLDLSGIRTVLNPASPVIRSRRGRHLRRMRTPVKQMAVSAGSAGARLVAGNHGAGNGARNGKQQAHAPGRDRRFKFLHRVHGFVMKVLGGYPAQAKSAAHSA